MEKKQQDEKRECVTNNQIWYALMEREKEMYAAPS